MSTRTQRALALALWFGIVGAAAVAHADDAEEPAAEEPTAEESTAEEPAAEEPTAEEPAAEEPAAEEPAAEEPAAEEPAAEEPAAEEPAAEEPAAEEPAAEEPAAEEPPVEEPAAEAQKVGPPPVDPSAPWLWFYGAIGGGAFNSGLMGKTRLQVRSAMLRNDSVLFQTTYAGAGFELGITPPSCSSGPGSRSHRWRSSTSTPTCPGCTSGRAARACCRSKG